MAEAGVPLPNSWHRISYFHCSLFGYFLGLLTATVSSEVSIFTKKKPYRNNVFLFACLKVFKAAQPALLYLVPFTLLPLCLMAYLKGDLKTMWHEPFSSNNYAKIPKYQDI